MTDIKITQADRDAAAEYTTADGRDVLGFCRAVTDGAEDSSNVVQAFAAHRQAAVDPMLAALEAVDVARHTDEPQDWQRATDLTAAAIQQAKGETK